MSTVSEIETDIFNAAKFLQNIEGQISEIQGQISIAIDAAQPEYLNYCLSLQSLTHDVEAIKTEISRFENTLETSRKTSDRAIPEIDLNTVSRRVKKLQCASHIIQKVLKINSLFNQFTNALNYYHPDIAADCLNTSSSLIDSMAEELAESSFLFASKTNSSSGMPNLMMSEDTGYTHLLRFLKFQLLGKQSQLAEFVNARLQEFIQFFPKNIQVSLECHSSDSLPTSLTLEQLWHAVKGSPLVKDSLTHLITSLIECVIDPVALCISEISAEKKLVCKNIITGGGHSYDEKTQQKDKNMGTPPQDPPSLPSHSRSSPSTAIWTCIEVNCPKDQQLHEETRDVQLLTTVLENLFEFIAKHFFPGHPDLLEEMGKALWPDLSEFLKNFVSEDDTPSVLDCLRDLETKLKALHVVPFATNILPLFCSHYDHVVFNTRRSWLLSQVRQLCIALDPAVVTVGENGSHDILLKNMTATLELLKKDKSDTPFHLLQSLEQSPLVLPKCNVSKAAFKTVEMIDELLKNVLDRIGAQGLDDNLFSPTIETIRDAVSFFVFLRATLHFEKFATDTHYAAVFYCDLLFLSRRMLLILPTVEKYIPRVIQARQCQISLLDMVTTIRPVQEEVFQNMVMYHRGELMRLCEKMIVTTQLSLDREYMTAEAKIAEALQYLKCLLVAWMNGLPDDLVSRAFAKLLDCFLMTFLQQICEKANSSTLAIADANAIAFLLASTNDQLSTLLYTLESIGEYTTMWTTFSLFRELLDADVPQFLSQKRLIREKISVQHIQAILAINVRKNVPASDIVAMLMSTDEI